MNRDMHERHMAYDGEGNEIGYITRHGRDYAIRFVRRRGGHHMLDDLAQEAELGILRARKTFDPSKSSFPTYARMWAFAYMSRYMERTHEFVHLRDSVYEDSSQEMEELEGVADYRRCEQDDTRLDRSRALAAVAERTRQFLTLRAEGHTLQEIADGAQISRERVRQVIAQWEAKCKTDAMQ